MAKRRRLETPSAAQLNEIEEGFARETKPGALGPIPPIAQIAADAAASADVADPQARAAQALDKADAERYRAALADGLVVQRVALKDIDMDALARDRTTNDPEAMEELKNSIRLHGLRLPIDLFERANWEEGAGFGLISGWRRLMAYRALAMETGAEEYDTIPAFVRDMEAGAKAYVAMVEENEIRANLSQYERGRIAVMAVVQGAFGSVEEAVNALFESGSKAKRSKIRSFAELHEEMGDVLSFAAALSERQGLRLVAAIRNGYLGEMRDALAAGQGGDPAAEWGILEPYILLSEEAGKPAKKRLKDGPKTLLETSKGRGYSELPNGIIVDWDRDGPGYVIRLEGGLLNDEVFDVVLESIKHLLNPE